MCLELQTFIHNLDKAFKGNVANRVLQSLHGGSIKITLIVPLIFSKKLHFIKITYKIFVKK